MESLLDRRELAEALRISERALGRLEERGMPRVELPGRGRRPMVRYRLGDVLAWSAQLQAGQCEDVEGAR